MAIQRWLELLSVRWARHDPGGRFDSSALGKDLSDEVSRIRTRPQDVANIVNPTTQGPAVEGDVCEPDESISQVSGRRSAIGQSSDWEHRDRGPGAIRPIVGVSCRNFR